MTPPCPIATVLAALIAATPVDKPIDSSAAQVAQKTKPSMHVPGRSKPRPGVPLAHAN